ncbi:NAD(P)-dependent oxidoreductase [Foetidibacter luteolus]|uniref:NAD(P)-dependent oxidoreductase n=1 Tax=Foetidibacter luteolus TaxID=2608880 RepID=UPI0021CF929B|nr:NAD(P)-dependent oxidoreductase [Foetidibacter luteolus]
MQAQKLADVIITVKTAGHGLLFLLNILLNKITYMTLGFIGLGNLGTPIAENLLNKGHALQVYNRTASKADALKAKGAIVCSSIKQLATDCDIVFSIVSDDAALQAITSGPDGIATHLKSGGIHISISTVLPATSNELAGIHQQNGSHYIACPVMGRPEAAKARKLNFLTSGSKATIEIIRPLLQDAGAANVWEFGEAPGAANVAKLCSNFLIVTAIESMAEGINLAQRSGLNAGAWMNMLTQTLFTSPIYVNYSNILLKEVFEPGGFALKLGLKDVNLVLQQATETSSKMPFGQQAKLQLEQCMQQGLAEHDWTAVALALK